MKKIIVLLFICVSCGKSALDQKTEQTSALSTPLTFEQKRLSDCKTQVQWNYNNCMKMFSPYDPVDVRQRRLDTCENGILANGNAHCDRCESHNWNLTDPIVHRWPDICKEVFDRVLTQPPGTTDIASQVWTIVNRRTVCTPVPDTYEQCKETDYTYHPYL